MREVRKFRWTDQIAGSTFMKPIALSDLHLSEMVFSTYVHEQQLIKIIDRQGRAHISEGVGATVVAAISQTIKIEGVEKLSAMMAHICDTLGKVIYKHFSGPVTAHVFMSKPGSGTFELHTDPDDVVLYVVDGRKEFLVDGKPYSFEAGDAIYIPKNTPHRAINVDESVMISFGLEEWIIHKLT